MLFGRPRRAAKHSPARWAPRRRGPQKVVRIKNHRPKNAALTQILHYLRSSTLLHPRLHYYLVNVYLLCFQQNPPNRLREMCVFTIFYLFFIDFYTVLICPKTRCLYSFTCDVVAALPSYCATSVCSLVPEVASAPARAAGSAGSAPQLRGRHGQETRRTSAAEREFTGASGAYPTQPQCG